MTSRIPRGFPSLFRDRTVPVPTVWGWLLFLAFLTGATVFCAFSVHPFLSPHDPFGEGYLVVEGWLPDYALLRAKEFVDSGRYERVLTTGGPLERGSFLAQYGNLAMLACSTLHRMGIADSLVMPVPSPATRKDRTYVSARSLGAWLARQGEAPEHLDLLTLGAHGRRSRILFRRALPRDIAVGVISVEDENYEPQKWWRSSAGVRTVIGEFLAYLYAVLVFSPDDV